MPRRIEGGFRAPLLLSGLAVLAVPAAAQRTGENVITAAPDAYGTSVGGDTIGLYRATWVRGFSPTVAGNAKLDGLYFDQVWTPSQRISTGTKVRVGLSVFGSPFPAPTGVIDYELRRPAERSALSLFAGVDSFGAALVEADASIPLAGPRLSLGLGAAAYKKAFHNGTAARQYQGSAVLRWRPSDGADVTVFASRSDEPLDEIGPVYVAAGAFLPPLARRRRHVGPAWAVHRGTAANYGVIAAVATSRSSRVRAGVFHSYLDNPSNFSNLITQLGQDGLGRQLVTADPPARTAATSGEIRWTLQTGGRRFGHAFHVSVRGRKRDREYGGSQAIDLGPVVLDAKQSAPKPDFRFGETSRDRVDQLLAGAAYELRWVGRLEADLALQYSRYRKDTFRPQTTAITASSNTLLANGAVAIFLKPSLIVYGGYTRGLEEGGVAPVTALNRNEAAPALRTRQVDGGLRWQLSPDLRAIAGIFDVAKPYYSVDENNVWRRSGEVSNRGAEFSLSGKLRPNLSVVAGAAFIDPRVTGEAVRSGRIGRRPTDTARTTLLLSADWKVPGLEALSFNVRGAYTGRVMATLDNRVSIPSRLILDAGARYRFKLAGSPASARLHVTNVGNEYGFTLRSPGAYGLLPGRLVSFSLAADISGSE